MNGAEPHPPGRRLFPIVGAVLLFPVRVAGILALLVSVPGWIALWQLPGLARAGGVDPTLLTFRLTNPENAAHPFRLLGYEGGLRNALVDLTPPGGSGAVAVSVKPGPGQNGAFYTVDFLDGTTAERPHTTPRLNVPADEIDRAGAAVRGVFDPKDAARWQGLLDWGEGLFRTAWFERYPTNRFPESLVPGPAGGTEAERLWCVWEALAAGQPRADVELPELTSLFDAAFEAPEARQAALAWAADLRRRHAAEYASFQRVYEPTKAFRWNTSFSLRLKLLASLESVLPPRTSWAEAWLVYQHVGLTAPSRAAARARWLGCFPPSRHDGVLAFGDRVAAERRAAGEPLPDVPEVVPLVCAVHRLVGADPYGQRCREALDKDLGITMQLSAHDALLATQPVNAFHFVAASRDAFWLFPTSRSSGTLGDRVAATSVALLFVTVTSLGFRAVIAWFVVPWGLNRTGRSRWQSYARGRGREPFLPWAAGVILATVLGAEAARFTLPEAVAVQVDAPGELLLGTFSAVVTGGLIVAACRRAVAVVLVAAKIDVERSLADVGFGCVAGAVVLLAFGNDIGMTAAAVLVDLTAGLLYGLTGSPRRPEALAARANFQPAS